MSNINASQGEKVTRINNAAAAATSDLNTSSVDMANFEGVKFYVVMGTVVSGAATSAKVGTSSDDSTFNDLLGSSQTIADDDDNQVVVIDIYRPLERYLRVTVLRATQNSTVDGVIAVQYGPRVLPTSDDSTTVVGREVHVSPIEGTA